MMRRPRLATHGADLLGRGVREVADSLAAGIELVGLGLYLFWLHLVLGTLLIAKLVLSAVRRRTQ